MTDDSPSYVNYDRAVMALEDRLWTNEPEKARIAALENLNAVPIEELEQLADEFDKERTEHARKAGETTTDEGQSYQEGLSHMAEQCAQELRELLENHR